MIAGSSLLVVMPGFEPGVRRFDSCPRSFFVVNRVQRRVSLNWNDAGNSLLVAMLDSESSGAGSIPAPATKCTEVIRPDQEPVLKTGSGLARL